MKVIAYLQALWVLDAETLTVGCVQQLKQMGLTRGDKTDAIIAVAIAVGACLVWWLLVR